MATKIDMKEIGKNLLLGSGVVILTPFLSGLVSGVQILAFEIFPGVISVGTALAAGVSAFGISYMIDKFM